LVTRGWLHHNRLTLTANSTLLDFEQHPPSSDQLTNYTIASADDKVELWVLPKAAGMRTWLHNTDPKQKHSLFQNVLVHRCDNVSLAREDECLQLLMKGDDAICIGLPGIGKSVSTTAMLVKALETIVQRHRTSPGETLCDGFEEVFYRVGEVVYKFAWDKEKEALGCEAISEAPKVAAIMRMFRLRSTFFDESYKRCLLVDMKEKEVDPLETAFYTAAAEDVFERTFKTLKKASAHFFLIEPPSELALRVMYLAARKFAPPLPSHIDTVEKFEALKAKIGPVPRHLFYDDKELVNVFLKERSVAARNPWKDVDLDDVSISNVGRTFQLFVAPFIRKGATTANIGGVMFKNNQEQDIYQFRCLSDHCKIVLATHVTQQKHIDFLSENGDDVELLEAVAVHAGLMTDEHALTSSLPKRCRKENWLVYLDPSLVKLMGHHRLTNSTVAAILPRCNRKLPCGSTAFARPVWELEEGVVYDLQGTPHSVVGSWSVNHTTKQLVGLRATTSVFSQHPFDIAGVDRVFDQFSLDEERGRQYTVVIVGVNDMSLANPDGLRFKNGTGDAHSLNWWQEETLKKTKSSPTWPHSSRVETYLMRIPVFDMPPFELTDVAPDGKMEVERKANNKARKGEIAELEDTIRFFKATISKLEEEET
jgi:hypothetical protein